MKKSLLIVMVVLIGITIKSVFINEFNQDGIYLKFSLKEAPFNHNLKSFAIRIQRELDKEDIVYDYIKVENNQLIFENLDEDDNSKIDKILNNYRFIFNIEKNHFIYRLSFLPNYLKKQAQELLENTKKVLEKRLENLGLYNRLFDVFLSEKTSIKISKNRFIEITIPHLCAKCPNERVKQLLCSVGYFSMMPVDDNDEVQKKSLPILDSSFVKKASVVFNHEKPQLRIDLNEKGTKLLADYTAMNILNKVAIVIDGKTYTKPRIVNEIFNGILNVALEGLNVQEIHDLTLVFNSGLLTSPIQVENERYIIWEK